MRRLRVRGDGVYGKEALSLTDLVDQMRSRGLSIPDQARAERYLRHVGYYRLSPYMIPFQEPGGTHRFDPNVAFDDVLALYVFDRKLRLLLLDAIERVEVAVRAALTDTMAIRGGPHWYTSPSCFSNSFRHAELLAELEKENAAQLRRPAETEQSRFAYPSALEHYLTRFGAPELPPSWIMVESRTLGQLSRIYSNIERRADRQEIARCVGTNEALLESWLRTYQRVRNICAHHGRLWNVGLGVYPKVPTSVRVPWPRQDGAVPDRSPRRLYPVVVTLQSILKTVSPSSSWGRRLMELLEENPQVPLRAMGMPPGWHSDPFWAT